MDTEKQPARITILQARYALEIAKRGNMHRAAAHLSISEPTMSSAVKLIEKALGFDLFYRGRTWWQSLILTPEGKQILPTLQRMVDAHDDALTQASKIKERRQLAESKGA